MGLCQNSQRAALAVKAVFVATCYPVAEEPLAEALTVEEREEAAAAADVQQVLCRAEHLFACAAAALRPAEVRVEDSGGRGRARAGEGGVVLRPSAVSAAAHQRGGALYEVDRDRRKLIHPAVAVAVVAVSRPHKTRLRAVVAVSRP